MHFAHFFNVLAIAAALAQAAPAPPAVGDALVARNAATDVRTTASAHIERDTATPEDHHLHRRNIITRYTRMRQGDNLLLHSGVNIVCNLLSVGRATQVAVPALSGVSNNLDVMGNALGQHVSSATGAQVSGALLSVHWATSNSQTPAITSLEWQTLLFAMYQVLPGSGWDYVTATFSYGGQALSVFMTLT
ncbi:hypothetical protein B0H63DRAFT_449816 [Podospora didyma]|uniref:Uncharacterized protein n=1 Tax=Podospora didyma TaxID=330526 RepID=A0AAE0NQH5_9PEZI|nr:hypothetical protein B0H63DRAFT_449816 [Podospora didyma]